MDLHDRLGSVLLPSSLPDLADERLGRILVRLRLDDGHRRPGHDAAELLALFLPRITAAVFRGAFWQTASRQAQ